MLGTCLSLPKYVHRQHTTGKYYFEFSANDTLLLGPQRVTMQEALVDKNAIMGAHAENPREFAGDAEAFAKGKAECTRISLEWQSDTRGIQSRLGGFLVTRNTDGKKTVSAMRFTFASAVEAREDLLRGKDIPWKLDEIRLLQGALDAPQYSSLFVGFCGLPDDNTDCELQGRAGVRKLELPSHTTWINMQDCGHDHLDGNRSFQRCPLRPTTTLDTCLERVKGALRTVASKNTDCLPLLVYLQCRVYMWLFRLSRTNSGKIWDMFHAATIVLGPNLSRLHARHAIICGPFSRR